MVLTAVFLVVPLALRDTAGLAVERHWLVYLPVLLLAVALMVPLAWFGAYLLRFNPWIAAGLLVEILFIAAIVYIPIFHGFFSTAPLPLWVWGAILLVPWVVFSIEELRKWLVRRTVQWLAV